jgi:hypothetical protein
MHVSVFTGRVEDILSVTFTFLLGKDFVLCMGRVGVISLGISETQLNDYITIKFIRIKN